MIEFVFQVIITVAKAKQSASSLESICKMPAENSRVNNDGVREKIDINYCKNIAIY
jgi:hypothetical protein